MILWTNKKRKLRRKAAVKTTVDAVVIDMVTDMAEMVGTALTAATVGMRKITRRAVKTPKAFRGKRLKTRKRKRLKMGRDKNPKMPKRKNGLSYKADRPYFCDPYFMNFLLPSGSARTDRDR